MALQGNLIGITVDDVYYRCQTDLTLNLTTNTNVEDPCKPAPGETDEGYEWDDPTITGQAWDATFSARSFADSVEGNQADLIEKLVAGTVIAEIEVSINTGSSQFDGTEQQLFTGTGIITGFTLNAGSADSSTYDTTILGKGKPNFVRTPITPTP